MPRNPLLGIQKEDEEIVEAGPEAQAEELKEEVSEEEVEESEESFDEDESEDEEDEEDESEDEEDEEEKPAVKNGKSSRKPSGRKSSGKKLKKASDAALEAGTLGDAYVDKSVPMSAKANIYLGMLLKSPLVPSIIPPDVLNEDSEHTFCINSLRIVVPKGRMIKVPLMLAEEIKQSFKNRF